MGRLWSRVRRSVAEIGTPQGSEATIRIGRLGRRCAGRGRSDRKFDLYGVVRCCCATTVGLIAARG
jgi:hypothetical protein